MDSWRDHDTCLGLQSYGIRHQGIALGRKRHFRVVDTGKVSTDTRGFGTGIGKHFLVVSLEDNVGMTTATLTGSVPSGGGCFENLGWIKIRVLQDLLNIRQFRDCILIVDNAEHVVVKKNRGGPAKIEMGLVHIVKDHGDHAIGSGDDFLSRINEIAGMQNTFTAVRGYGLDSAIKQKNSSAVIVYCYLCIGCHCPLHIVEVFTPMMNTLLRWKAFHYV
jgi:hypothetical protein